MNGMERKNELYRRRKLLGSGGGGRTRIEWGGILAGSRLVDIRGPFLPDHCPFYWTRSNRPLGHSIWLISLLAHWHSKVLVGSFIIVKLDNRNVFGGKWRVYKLKDHL